MAALLREEDAAFWPGRLFRRPKQAGTEADVHTHIEALEAVAQASEGAGGGSGREAVAQASEGAGGGSVREAVAQGGG